MARHIGIDLGTKRIGIALSDPSGTIASPLLTLESKGLAADLLALVRLADEHEAGGFVLGLPVLLSGREGGMAAKIKLFAKHLRAASPRPVILADERFSTRAAERALLEANTRRDKRRDLRDAVAAALILQSWLDAQPRRTSSEPDPQ